MKKQRNKGQNKPSTKPSAPAQRTSKRQNKGQNKPSTKPSAPTQRTSKRQNKGQNKPSTKPSAPAQRQQGQAGPQEGQITVQEGQITVQEGQITLQEDQATLQESQAPLLRMEKFKGPLPPPDELEKYERVAPGAAKRIIAMAEKQSNHRYELERTSVDKEYKQAGKGQNYAGILGALAIIFGTIAGMLGAQLTGSLIGGLVVVGLVSVFIRGRRGN